jgi:hypothetical protein
MEQVILAILYNGYTGDANGNHKPLLLNATIWLATSSSNLNVNDQAQLRK